MNKLKLALFASLMAASALAPAAAATKLILAEAGPDRGPRAEATKWFAKEVESRTAGNVTVEVHWGGALFSANSAVSALRNGVADLGTVIGVYFPQDMLAYDMADIPIPNEDPWVGMRAVDDIMRTDPKVQENLAEQNLVYVGTFTTSAVQVGCKGKTIRTLEDLKGVKVRGVGAYGKAFKDLGAVPVDMSVYEAYQGLETGLLDCTQTYPYLVKALKFNEVFDSYTELDWGQVGALGVFMNKDSFDALSEADQAAVMEAGKGMADEFGKLLMKANTESVDILKAEGKEVLKLSDADHQKLLAAGEPYIAEWVQRADAAGLDGEGMVQQYKDLIKQYRAERDAKGYPWDRK